MWSYAKLTLWAVTWLILWVVFKPVQKGRQNCLTYALKKWDKEGGYFVIRWCRSSKYNWLIWPHFLWLDEKYGRYLEHAVPIDDNHTKQPVPSPWFKEKVKQGDRKDKWIEN